MVRARDDAVRVPALVDVEGAVPDDLAAQHGTAGGGGLLVGHGGGVGGLARRVGGLLGSRDGGRGGLGGGGRRLPGGRGGSRSGIGRGLRGGSGGRARTTVKGITEVKVGAW